MHPRRGLRRGRRRGLRATTARSWPARWALLPMLGARLARLTFAPDLLISDGESLFLAGVPPLVAKARRGRGLDAVPPGLRRGRLGPAPRDDGRHPDRPVRQPEHLRHRRLRAADRASCSVSAARPATPSTTARSYWVPEALPAGVRRAGRHRLRCRLRPRDGARHRGRAVQRHPPGGHQPGRPRLRRPRRHGAAAVGPPGRHGRRGRARPPGSSWPSPATSRTTREPDDGGAGR